jgi:hypothetical protein
MFITLASLTTIGKFKASAAATQSSREDVILLHGSGHALTLLNVKE